MSKDEQFNLPDLAEGLVDAEIITWLVKAGDEVTLNQPIVEVETAKALTEIPSPYAGRIKKLHHDAGTTVDVGQPLVTFEVEGTADATQPAADSDEDDEEQPKVLVGYGPKKASAKRRPRKSDNGAAPTAPAPAPAPEPAPAPAPAPTPEPPKPARPDARVAVLAKPPVRKLAKDLGIDLAQLTGTGPQGSITRGDVESARQQPAPATAAPARGGEERIPIKGVRKATAANMVSSAFTAPHVTEFLQLDVTETVEYVARLKQHPDFADVKVSPLLLVAKALLLAARRHPMVNSSWDEERGQIVVKHYVNLGIAAATPRGLVVPNIKNAESLSLHALAEALGSLTTLARDGKTPPADMGGGTMTITNVGVFGIDTGTPILPPGESAILAVGAIRDMPWVHEGQIVPRKVTTLSLSFDHRIIDGELGSKFLADVGRFLSDPGTTSLAWT